MGRSSLKKLKQVILDRKMLKGEGLIPKMSSHTDNSKEVIRKGRNNIHQKRRCKEINKRRGMKKAKKLSRERKGLRDSKDKMKEMGIVLKVGMLLIRKISKMRIKYLRISNPSN